MATKEPAKNPNHELQSQHIIHPAPEPTHAEMAYLQQVELNMRQEMELEISRRFYRRPVYYRYYTKFYRKVILLMLDNYIHIWRMKNLLHNGNLLRLGVDYFLDVWVKAIEFTPEAVAEMRTIAKEKINPILIEEGFNQSNINTTMAGKMNELYLKENIDSERILEFTMHIKDPDKAIPELGQEEDE